MEALGIKESIAALAKACARDLTPSAFEYAWNAATSQHLESIGVGADSGEQMRMRLEYLHREYALPKFITALIARQPPPEKPVRDAISALVSATMIDTADWSGLDESEKQEIFVDRDAFMQQADLSDFCYEVWPRMCCLVGKVKRLGSDNVMRDIAIGGSGFLVGPDIVMTNSHVIEPLLSSDRSASEPGSDKNFCVFFDHFRTQKIDDHTADYKGVLKVAPAAKWLVARSPQCERGADDSEMDEHLDYALIRLSSKVGYAARNRRGGSPRGWVRLPSTENMGIDSDSRVAIPQHPERSGLVLDIGRVAGGLGRTRSRITYHVNTRHGSSGSPVLASGGMLAALHEGTAPSGAGFRHKKPWNQGVRVDAFRKAIAEHLPRPEDDWRDHFSLWCVGGNRQEPLIGRREFIDWIEQSRIAPCSQDKASWPPVCVITGEKGSGKSFSAKILAGLVVPRGDDVVVFRAPSKESASGLDGAYELPHRPDSIVSAVSEKLAFKSDVPIPAAPPDPEHVEIAAGFVEAKDNKPNDWASVQLPKWLMERLQELFNGQPGRHLWIVFDFAPNTSLQPFMQSFLDSWTTPVGPEHPFSKCRFVFIGLDPAFRTTREKWPMSPNETKLSPVKDIQEADLACYLDAAHAAAGREVPPGMPELLADYLLACKKDERSFWSTLSVTCRKFVAAIHKEEQ